MTAIEKNYSQIIRLLFLPKQDNFSLCVFLYLKISQALKKPKNMLGDM